MALVTATGALAPSFGTNGRRLYAAFTRTTGADVVCTGDGKFVITGTIDHPSPTLAPTEAYAARFDATGASDNTFGLSFGIVGFGVNTSGASGGRDDQGKAIAIDSSGRFYAAFDAQFSGADYDFGVARLTGALLFADGFE